MLKKSLPEFASAMFAATVLLSVVFTFLYLPDVKGLALDDTARNFFDAASGALDVLLAETRLGHKVHEDEWLPCLVETFQHANVLPPAVIAGFYEQRLLAYARAKLDYAHL